MSGAFSFSHMIVVAAVVLIFFGKGKVSGIMGEVGQGLTAFKKGLRDGETDDSASSVRSLQKDETAN